MSIPVYPTLLNDSFRPQWERLVHLWGLGFSPRTILDIGAYHGGWSVLARAIWSEAEVLSIEANPDCAPHLERHGQNFMIATLSNTAEKKIFWNCADVTSGEGNSLYKENSLQPFTQSVVDTQTLDALALGKTFDFIKIDCQGAELLIIKGGERVVREAQMVLLETQIQEYNQGAPDMLRIMNEMDSRGFRLYDIIEQHRNARGLLLQTDLLFARKDSLLFHIRPL